MHIRQSTIDRLSSQDTGDSLVLESHIDVSIVREYSVIVLVTELGIDVYRAYTTAVATLQRFVSFRCTASGEALLAN